VVEAGEGSRGQAGLTRARQFTALILALQQTGFRNDVSGALGNSEKNVGKMASISPNGLIAQGNRERKGCSFQIRAVTVKSRKKGVEYRFCVATAT
jgi:hypothetical protein